MSKSKNTPPLEFWAVGKKSGYYYHISEGTGDNLLQEDIDLGYVDYIYYDYYQTLQDIHCDQAFDGGMILLEKLYADMTTEEILNKFADFEEEVSIIEEVS